MATISEFKIGERAQIISFGDCAKHYRHKLLSMGLTPGAILLAVPLVWGGYTFLRDPELAGYRGTALYIRVGVCALGYVLLWGIWAFLRPLWGFTPGEMIDLPWMVVIVPAMICVGALLPFSSLDFDYTTAALHYGLYLGVCVLLRVIMHLPPL